MNKELNASITVEAAFSFTITIFVLFLMIGPLFIIKTSSDILVELNGMSKVRCNYQMIKDHANDLKIYNDIAEKVDSDIFTDENLSTVEKIINYTVMGIDYATNIGGEGSEYRNINFAYDMNPEVYDEETGIVNYDFNIGFNLPYNLLHVSAVNKRLVLYRRAFIGSVGDRFNGGTDDGEYVYVANNCTNSSVYHTFINCSYLIKQVDEVPYSNISSKRNENNERYSKCDYCFKRIKMKSDTICYITEWGDKYHYRSNCPLMTAYVTKIPKEYVEQYNLRLCPRCGNKGEK